MNSSVLKYFPNITDIQIRQFEQMGSLYPEWNSKINVISRKDIDNLYMNHILHSLSIAKFMTPIDGTTFLDMGTGGGFPGIPLATMFPNCKFHLIDRIGKKIKVATEIANEIGLKNVTFQHGDIGECRQKYDFVVSRAVMRLDELLPLIRKNVAKGNKNKYQNGLICLKGGDLNDELNAVSYPVIDFPITEFFNESFFETKKIIYVPM
ncbi:MAG: 16S rRNA (guanine(527)-N(7))-methyltransferase RsmG [Muribaculaceae bacterium]|nr:16S rRNA (guanine(527)-N(7))-methyltransferase RsmG [Muribaculaceae bacterium]